MRVRPAVESDCDFVVHLAHRFAAFELPPWLDRKTVAEGTAAQLMRAIRSRDRRSEMLVAEGDDGSQLGFAWLVLIPDFYGGNDLAKISEIAVSEDGRGVGSLLMKAAETWARERGCSRIVLNVMQGNRRAWGFYERHGFEPEYTMLVKCIEPPQ